MKAVGLRRVGLCAALLFASLCAYVTVAHAHHILGIPHYAYDEDYPQTPVLTYRVEAGRYEMRFTGYPGELEPGDKCSIHVYVTELGSGAPFDGTVTLTVLEDRLLGDDPIVYGPMTGEIEEAVFKFYPRFEHEKNYVARVYFAEGDVPWTIDVPMVVGEPGDPLAVLGLSAAGLVVFLVVVRAARIKMRRRQRTGEQTESYEVTA